MIIMNGAVIRQSLKSKIISKLKPNFKGGDDDWVTCKLGWPERQF